jgi:hypothetical protein
MIQPLIIGICIKITIYPSSPSLSYEMDTLDYLLGSTSYQGTPLGISTVEVTL